MNGNPVDANSERPGTARSFVFRIVRKRLNERVSNVTISGFATPLACSSHAI